MNTREPILVGVDIGTTNLKAVAIDRHRRVLSVQRRPMVIAAPAPGASEFDLAALDRALHEVLSATVAVLEAAGEIRSQIAAIAVDSIGESFVGLDSDDRPILPCPTWYDRRTARFRSEAGVDPQAWYDTTGMVDDDIYTIWRIMWWRRELADAVSHVARWFSVADYAVYRLAAAQVANPSLAARTGLADRTSLDWSDEHLAIAGVDRRQMPRMQLQGTVAGRLSGAAAARTGLRQGTPVVNAGHDHPCAGWGCGVVAPAVFVDSAGTAESLITLVGAPLAWEAVNRGEYDCYPYAAPGSHLLSAHIPSSGAAIDWMTARLAGPDPPGSVADRVRAMAAAAPPGAGGVRVAPYLQGTGSPWNRRDERLHMAGIDRQSGPGEMLRAVYEGLAAWLCVNVGRFEAISGARPDHLLLTGGGSRNRTYSEIKAAMLGRRLLASDIAEAAGVGAALVGGLAVGLFADAGEAVADPSHEVVTIKPDPELAAAYDGLRAGLIAYVTPSP